MNRCGKLMVDNLRSKAGEPFDVKLVTGAYSMDVIASTAFSLDIDSQKDLNDPFIVHAKKTFRPNITNPLILLLIFAPSLAPALERWFGISLFPKDTRGFFENVLDQILALKKKNDKSGRMDFMQLMANAQEADDDQDADEKGLTPGSEHLRKGLTYDEILSQGFICFIAGYASRYFDLHLS